MTIRAQIFMDSGLDVEQTAGALAETLGFTVRQEDDSIYLWKDGFEAFPGCPEVTRRAREFLLGSVTVDDLWIWT